MSNLRNDEPWGFPCPVCGAQLTRPSGGGDISCPACGLVIREQAPPPGQATTVRVRRVVIDSPTAPGWQSAPGPSLASRIASPLGCVTILAMVPLFYALRALFTGYDSFDPVLAGELYVWFFSALWLIAPTLFFTIRRLRMENWQALTLAATTIVTTVLIGRLAPQIGEPNYCGQGSHDHSMGFRAMPPRIFRCTSLPFQIAGGILGWWLGYWIIKWWEARQAETA